LAIPSTSRYALVFLFMTSLLDSIGFGIILPVLPSLIMDISGEGLSEAARYGGWLLFMYAVMQFLFAPLIGNLSDRLGRRPVLLFSMLVMGVNYLVMAMASTLALLFVGRMISGIGASTMSTCNAYIADTTPVEKRAQNFGLMGAAFGLGFVIGPVVGGLLGEYGPRVPFYAAAVLSIANMIFGFFILGESLTKENRRPFRIARANPVGTLLQLRHFSVVIGIILVMFLYQLGHHVLPSTWSFYTIERFDWTPREIGYSLGFIGVMMVLVQGFLIRWVLLRAGLRVAGIVGLSFTIIAFVGYAFASLPWMIYAAMIPGSLGVLAGPAMQGIASAQVDGTQQGELQGGLASSMSLTFILSPPVMTQLFAYFSGASAPIYFPGAPYLLAALLTAAGLALFIKVSRTSA